MKKSGKVTLAASAFVLAGLCSFSWSEQNGLSLSVEKAEARVGRPLTPVSVAGVARRQNRRAVYGEGAGYGMGAGYGTAAAVGTAAAIGTGAGYYAGSGPVRSARAAYNNYNYPTQSTPHYAVRAYYAGGPWYGYSGWDDYAKRNGITCTPGKMVKFDDGNMYACQ